MVNKVKTFINSQAKDSNINSFIADKKVISMQCFSSREEDIIVMILYEEGY